jgi:hypothetical protein
MSTARTRITLSSVHLDRDDLHQLNQLLQNAGENPRMRIEIEWDDFQREYDSLDELLTEPRTPNYIYKFNWKFYYDDGHISIDLLSSKWIHTSSRAFISGSEPKVRQRKSELNDFFNHRGNQLRTLLGSLRNQFGISVILFLFLVFLPQDLLNELPENSGIFGYLIMVSILYFGIQPIYPYSVVQLGERSILEPIGKVTTIIYSIVLMLGSIATIILLLLQFGII